MTRTPTRTRLLAAAAGALIAVVALLILTRERPDRRAAVEAGAARGPYPIRGIYSRDSSRTGFDHQAALGFNTIDSGPFPEQIRALRARSLKGFVWLGGYSNTRCGFNRSDAWVRAHVAAIAGEPAVAGYFIDDEPDAAACPAAPRQIKARAALVKAIDPRPPTFIVTYKVDQFKRFAGTVDILALDHYPCSRRHGCDYSIIDEQAAEVDRLGVRYWGVVQAHGDDYYKVPTPDELRRQFEHWRATRMEGYLVFAWRWPPDDPALWLANNPRLQSRIRAENGM